MAVLPVLTWAGVGAAYTAGKAAPKVSEPVPVLPTCTVAGCLERAGVGMAPMVWAAELVAVTREAKSRAVDGPEGFRNLTGRVRRHSKSHWSSRVESSQDVFIIPWVGSGRVRSRLTM